MATAGPCSADPTEALRRHVNFSRIGWPRPPCGLNQIRSLGIWIAPISDAHNRPRRWVSPAFGRFFLRVLQVRGGAARRRHQPRTMAVTACGGPEVAPERSLTTTLKPAVLPAAPLWVNTTLPAARSACVNWLTGWRAALAQATKPCRASLTRKC